MNGKIVNRWVVVLLLLLLVSFYVTAIGLAGSTTENDKSSKGATPRVVVRSDLSLFIYLGFLLLVLITVVLAVIWLKKREIDRYEEAVEDLKKDFEASKISEETYKQLRLEIEGRYDKRMKRMGFE